MSMMVVMVVRREHRNTKKWVASQEERKREVKWQEGEDGRGSFSLPLATLSWLHVCLFTSPVHVTEDGPTGALGL